MAYITKKHVAISVLAIVLAGGLFALFEYKNKPKEFDVAKLLVENTSTNGGDLTLSNKDSDNDGLLDWEEALWKTEINNPDTDGDGTVDGQEIKDGRDPAKAGPQDGIENYDNFQATNGSENQTETLAQQFLIAYAKLVESGDLTEENKTKIITELIAKTSVPAILGKVYTKNDLKIGDDSNQAIKEYGNNMGSLIANFAPRNIPNEKFPVEMVYLKKALETRDATDIAKLKSISEEYSRLVFEILKLEIPESAVTVHLGILNGLEKITNITASFSLSLIDPLRAMQSINVYVSIREELNSSVQSLKNYFEAKKITYTDKEYGYIYTHL